VIVFSLYFLILCFIIYRTHFFGILKDDVLNRKFILTAFVIKISSLAAFYIVYTRLYGTIYYSDTGNFFRDSGVINSIAYSNFGEFAKLMFGLQEDGEGTYIFKILEPTTTWDKTTDEILYNDNRLVLRFHALIHFISFGNYFIHALFSCFLSFIGINWIYKTFKDKFKDKEICFYLIWILFPGVWFWTSGVFKEGPALFILGMLLVSLKRVVAQRKYGFKNLLMLFIALQLSVAFKSYLMLPVLIATIVFFGVKNRTDRAVGLKYIGMLVIVFLIVNLVMQLVFKKDAVGLLAERQRNFIDVSHGGIFLVNEEKFIRAEYDFSLVEIDSTQKPVKARMKPGIQYTYFMQTDMLDTLYSKNNTDTSWYPLSYVIPKASTTFQPAILVKDWSSFLISIPYSLYIAAFKPFFFDARGTIDVVSSIENLILLLALLWFVYNGIKNGFRDPYYVYFLSIVVMVLVIIGITSPNLGAMERYRALAVPFILLTALLSSTIKDPAKLSNLFKN
jgi:hypothetical protein